MLLFDVVARGEPLMCILVQMEFLFGAERSHGFHVCIPVHCEHGGVGPAMTFFVVIPYCWGLGSIFDFPGVLISYFLLAQVKVNLVCCEIDSFMNLLWAGCYDELVGSGVHFYL